MLCLPFELYMLPSRRRGLFWSVFLGHGVLWSATNVTWMDYLNFRVIRGCPSGSWNRGVAPRGEQLEFPATANDHRAFAAICNHFHLQPGYVCIHPGVRAAGRRWDPVLFAAVADALARRGLRVVLTGTATESELTGAVARAMKAASIRTESGGRPPAIGKYCARRWRSPMYWVA